MFTKAQLVQIKILVLKELDYLYESHYKVGHDHASELLKLQKNCGNSGRKWCVIWEQYSICFWFLGWLSVGFV